MEFGGVKGKRAKGEQTGSLNSLFHRCEAFLKDLGPFQGFGAFFGDSWPFSGIRGLFGRFAAFLRIHGLFADSRPFCGFAAFLRIRGLFADSRPIRGFMAKGAKGANKPPGETFAT